MNYLLKKKKALMGVISILTRVLKSITGITSATLANVFDKKSLVLLECQGSQSGSGDKTENLLDDANGYNFVGNVANGVTNNDWIANNSGDVVMDVEANAVYTIAFDGLTKTSTDKLNIALYFRNSSNTIITSKVLMTGSTSALTKVSTINFGDNTTVKVRLASNGGVSTIDIKGLRIIKGSYNASTIPSWSAYGYKIGVLGYNTVFDPNKLTDYGYSGVLEAIGGEQAYQIQSNPYTMNIPMNCNGITIAFKTYKTSNHNGCRISVYYIDSLGNYKTQYYVEGTVKNAIVNEWYETTLTYNLPNVYKVELNNGSNGPSKRWYLRDILIYDSNKTPICLDTYIGGEQLKSYEYVTVDFENETAKIHTPNYFDMSKITNNTKGDLVVNEDGTITSSSYPAYTLQTLREVCPNLKVGDVVRFFAITTGYYAIYFKESAAYLNTNTLILTDKILDSHIGLYKQHSSVGGGDGVISNIVVYKRDEHDEYIGSVDPNLKNVKYRHQDVTNLNSHLFELASSSFDGTNVLVDNSINKVSEMRAEFYNTEPEICIFKRDSIFQPSCWGRRLYEMSKFSDIFKPNVKYKISFDVTCEKINYDTFKSANVGIIWVGNTNKNKRPNLVGCKSYTFTEGSTYHYEWIFSLPWVTTDDYYGMYAYANYGTLNGATIGNDVTIRNLKICQVSA